MSVPTSSRSHLLAVLGEEAGQDALLQASAADNDVVLLILPSQKHVSEREEEERDSRMTRQHQKRKEKRKKKKHRHRQLGSPAATGPLPTAMPHTTTKNWTATHDTQETPAAPRGRTQRKQREGGCCRDEKTWREGKEGENKDTAAALRRPNTPAGVKDPRAGAAERPLTMAGRSNGALGWFVTKKQKKEKRNEEDTKTAPLAHNRRAEARARRLFKSNNRFLFLLFFFLSPRQRSVINARPARLALVVCWH
jgi:hypothetical protein